MGLRYGGVGDLGTFPAIFLHGRGGSDSTFAQKLRETGLYIRGLYSWGRGFQWTIGSFADPGFGADLDAAVERLLPFVQSVVRCYGKPLLSGHSQGGAVALRFALLHPELLRGVVVASASLPALKWQRFTVPAVIVQGTADPVVRYEGVQRMATATGARLVTVKGAGHELDGDLLRNFKLSLSTV